MSDEYNVDGVGLLLLEALHEVTDKLEKEKMADDLALIPSILLTIAVIELCKQFPPDSVMEMLETMKLKVELGDFAPEKYVLS
jgi:hypothetical protein